MLSEETKGRLFFAEELAKFLDVVCLLSPDLTLFVVLLFELDI